MSLTLSSRLAGSVKRVLVAVGLGAALVLGSTGAASAGTWSFDDPTGDVVVYDAGSGDYEGSEPAPDRAAGDVRRVSVSHMQSKLVVRLTLRHSLPRSDWGIFKLIQTPRAMFGLILHRYEGSGFVGLSRFSENGGRVRCAGLAVTYAPRSVQISIPSRCLGTPRVVKIAASVDTGDGEERYYKDDALRRGMSHMGLRFSPQIPRG